MEAICTKLTNLQQTVTKTKKNKINTNTFQYNNKV